MPPRPTYQDITNFVPRPFTDREAERAFFMQELWKQQCTDSYRIIAWSGVGGQGKSALARELLRVATEENGDKDQKSLLGIAFIDFDRPQNRMPDHALLSIRRQLARSAGISFPCFDTAFIRLAVLENPDLDVRKCFPELFKSDNEVFNDIWELACDIADSVPGVNLLYKYGTRGSDKLKSWWKKRGRTVLAGLDLLNTTELLERLPVFLGADIKDFMDSNQEQRLLLVLDSHEKFWNNSAIGSGYSSALVDTWVRRMVEECPGIFIVLFSRETLIWAEVDSEWTNVIEQLCLLELKDRDCHDFLITAGIQDLLIREKIVRSARGLPFYLHLQLDLFRTLTVKGTVPSPVDFGGSHPEILMRSLDHLSEADLKLLTLLSYPRQIEHTILPVLAKYSEEIDFYSLDDVLQKSIFKPLDDGAFMMHQLLRDMLQQREKGHASVRFKEIHRILFEYFKLLAQPISVDKVQKVHLIALTEAAFHCSIYDPSYYPKWIFNRQLVFANAGRWKQLEEPLAIGVDMATLTGQPVIRIYLHERLATSLKMQGRFKEAETIYLEVISESDTRDEINMIDYAQWKNNLGNLYYATERYDDAERLYEEAIAIGESERSMDKPHIDEWQQNLANLYHARGELDKAEILYQRAVDSCRQTKEPESVDLSLRLQGLGRFYQDTGQYKKAEVELETALDITRKALGPNHMYVAARLDNLGRLYRDQNRLDKAEAFCKEAVRCGEFVLGSDHPDLAIWLDNLALVYRDKKEFEKAELLCRRAIRIITNTYGNHHSHLAILLNNLSLILRETQRLKESIDVINQVLEIYLDVYGENHTWYAVALTNKGNLLRELGSYEEANAAYKQSAMIYEEKKLTVHPNYGRILHLEAKNAICQEKNDKAYELLNRVLEIYGANLEPDAGWVREAMADRKILEKKHK